MSLDNDFLDLEKKKHNSLFGIISTAIAILWLAYLVIPRYLGASIYSNDALIPIMALQFMGTSFAIISIKKKESRSILYLIGLIINGVGFLYFLINQIF